MSDSFLRKSCLSPRHRRRRYAANLRNLMTVWRTKLMKKFLLGTVALVALGATVPALAADLAARPAYTKAPAYVQPIYNWTGFYIGGHIRRALQGDNNGFARTPHNRNHGRLPRGVPAGA